MAPHQARFRVYYEDTDAGGVMYHARHLAFAERGRTEALREAGIPAARLLAEHGAGFVVRRLAAEYLRPLRLDDLVTVTTTVAGLGGTSLRLRQVLGAGNAAAAVLDVTLVAVRVADLRPVRIPEPWAGLLRSFEDPPGS